MFGLNLPAITPLAIKVSVRLLAVASLLSLASSATAEPGDLYATDTVAGSIVVFATDGTATTFASGLIDPQGIAVDDVGNVYVCEGTSGELLKFTPDGTMTILASGFSNPIGLAFDGFALLVAENGADAITKVTPDGTKIPLITVTAPVAIAVDNGEFFRHAWDLRFDLRPGRDRDRDPVDLGSNTRAVAVVADMTGGTLEQFIFVTTDENIIDMIVPDGTFQQFAPDTILQDPNGLAFLPALIGGGDGG